MAPSHVQAALLLVATVLVTAGVARELPQAPSMAVEHRQLQQADGDIHRMMGQGPNANARLGVKSVAYQVKLENGAEVGTGITCGSGKLCPYYDAKNRLRYCCGNDGGSGPTCGFGKAWCETCAADEAGTGEPASTCDGDHGHCWKYFDDQDLSGTPTTCSPIAAPTTVGPELRFCCKGDDNDDCMMCHDKTTVNVLLSLKKQDSRNRKRLAQWGTGNFCNWPGIYCDYGDVTKIDLYGFRLYGSLPASWGTDPALGLKKVTYMDFARNNFKGALPTEWTDMTALRAIWLDNNKLDTAPLPAEWSTLVSLEILTLNNNDFPDTTELPIEWQAMASLEELYLLPGNVAWLDSGLMCYPSEWKAATVPVVDTPLQYDAEADAPDENSQTLTQCAPSP